MLPSPFCPTAGAVPPVLAGRDELLAEVADLLERAAHFGTTSGPVVWTGGRGLGKTAAMLVASGRAAEGSFVVAHLGAAGADRLCERLVAAIAGGVAATGIDRTGRGWQRLADRLAGFGIEVGEAGSVSLGLQAAALTPDLLGSVIVDATIQAIGVGRTGLFLTLDDLHEAPAEDLLTLINALEALTSGSSPVVTLLAGLPVLKDRVQETGSFAGRYAYRSVTELSRLAAAEALVGPATALEVNWAPDGLELILGKCGGSAYLLQLHADAAWRAAAPEVGSVISEADAADGLARAAQDPPAAD
jgi:hypothetical protein